MYKKINITITHKADDYYGIEVNEIYREVDIEKGEAIFRLIQALESLSR